MAINSERIEFPGSDGQRLAARLELPLGRPAAYALFAHCFTCSKDVFAATRISTALAERGIAVLRFDFTGLGGSEGDFANTNFSSNVDDLVAAADYLRETRARERANEGVAMAVFRGHGEARGDCRSEDSTIIWDMS